jgi:hypothetical protein
MMFEWLARLLRVFRRQESEGAAGPADVIIFPASEVHAPPIETPPLLELEPVADDGPVPVPKPSAPRTSPSRHLSAQLQSVERLNQPKSRMRPKAPVSRADKPKPVASPLTLKRTSNAKPGAVLSRIAQTNRRAPSADIVDLAAVRRERHLDPVEIEAVEIEAIALCS